LAYPTVLDRFIQQALMQVLQRKPAKEEGPPSDKAAVGILWPEADHAGGKAGTAGAQNRQGRFRTEISNAISTGRRRW
jgi:hypothetical protein